MMPQRDNDELSVATKSAKVRNLKGPQEVIPEIEFNNSIAFFFITSPLPVPRLYICIFPIPLLYHGMERSVLHCYKTTLTSMIHTGVPTILERECKY
jgi:hypothetical protein